MANTKINLAIDRVSSPNVLMVDIGSASASFTPFGTVVGGAISLNAATATQRGGVYRSTASANKYATGIDASGNVTYAQPQFNDLANVSTQLFGTANTWTAQQAFGNGTFAATANYGAGITNSIIAQITGSTGSPTANQDAPAVFQKWSNVTGTSGVNATLYASIYKKTTGTNTRATAGYFEAQDTIGGSGSWAEGLKSIAAGTAGSNGSFYGGVFSAGTGTGISALYMVGAEGTVESHTGVDAPIWSSFNINSYSAAFSASCGTNDATANKADVAYVTNPYSGVPFRTGFAVYGNDGGGRIGVDHTAFAIKGSIPYGLDMRFATFSGAAIRLPNLGIVRARNAGDSADHNIMYYDGSNQLMLGTDATQTIIANQLYVGGRTLAQTFETGPPSTKTANYTVDSGASKDSMVIFNGAGSLTVTLPAAASYPGRIIRIKTIAAQTVVSASSNVVPLAGGAAGTAILAATAGKWADLQSDGANWIITASN